jgi:hypothetical protein
MQGESLSHQIPTLNLRFVRNVGPPVCSYQGYLAYFVVETLASPPTQGWGWCFELSLIFLWVTFLSQHAFWLSCHLSFDSQCSFFFFTPQNTVIPLPS